MKGYLQEAEWSNRGHLPSHEEYIEVGVASTAGEVLLAMTFIPMGDAAGVGVYEWLRSRPKLTHALFVKSRLRDDIATYKVTEVLYIYIYIYIYIYMYILNANYKNKMLINLIV